MCDQGWTGSACDCQDAPDQCTPPPDDNGVTGDQCSGHGSCRCGGCVCEDGWTGPYCQDCPTCLDTCDTLKQCVECVVWATGDLTDWAVDLTGKQSLSKLI